MATEQEYWNRLRRAAIACLSTSLRHGSPAMMDVLCELERAVYDGMAEPVAPVAPDPGLREAIREAVKAGMLEEKDRLKDGSVKEIFDSTTKAVLAVLAERGVR